MKTSCCVQGLLPISWGCMLMHTDARNSGAPTWVFSYACNVAVWTDTWLGLLTAYYYVHSGPVDACYGFVVSAERAEAVRVDMADGQGRERGFFRTPFKNIYAQIR